MRPEVEAEIIGSSHGPDQEVGPGFMFSATKDDVPYEVDIELFDKISVEV